jgi:hypothetical protein
MLENNKGKCHGTQSINKSIYRFFQQKIDRDDYHYPGRTHIIHACTLATNIPTKTHFHIMELIFKIKIASRIGRGVTIKGCVLTW